MGIGRFGWPSFVRLVIRTHLGPCPKLGLLSRIAEWLSVMRVQIICDEQNQAYLGDCEDQISRRDLFSLLLLGRPPTMSVWKYRLRRTLKPS